MSDRLYSSQEVVSDGTLTQLMVTVPFPEGTRGDLHVFFNGVEDDDRWTWAAPNVNTIIFHDPVPEGETVLVRRLTQMDEVPHIFGEASGATGNSQFSYETIDQNFDFFKRATQDSMDSFTLSGASAEQAKYWAQQAEAANASAEGHRNSASASAASASVSALNAGQSATGAEQSAQAAEGFRDQAEVAKDQAEAAAQSVQGVQDAVEDLRDETIGYRNDAQSSASDAAGSASAAAGSASSASSSAASAGTHATNAQNSAYDAANSASQAQTHASNASASASASQTSRLASEVARDESEAARDKAQQWAENPEDVPVEPGQYSAKHWALKAEGIIGGDAFMRKDQNLADVQDASMSRINLGLGTVATKDAGTGPDEVRTNTQNDSRFIQGGEVKQEFGDSTTDVMSQKGVTDALKRGRVFSPPVHELEYPLIISHRGGATIYPEHSMLGFKKSMVDGYYPEMDIQELADGELLLAHDSTADRTMRGVKGSFSTLTREEVEMGYLINAQTKCVLSQKPVFFEDLLDKLGGKIVLFPEIKQSAVGSTQRIIQAIQERGLEDWVVVQSFDYDACKDVAAAGLHALFLSENYPSQSPEEIFSDGIRFVGGKYDTYSQAQVTNLKNAGLKVIAYTVNSKDDLNAWLNKGGDGVFSDDPWYIDDNMEIVSSVDFKTGRGLSGIYAQSLDSSSSSKNELVALEDNTVFNQSGLFALNDYSSTRNKVFYFPQLQRVSPPFRIRVVFKHQQEVGAGGPLTGGLILFSPQSERDFVNDATANRDFISAVGTMEAWVSKSGNTDRVIYWSDWNSRAYYFDSIEQEMVLDVSDTELTLLNRTYGGYEKVQGDFSSFTDLLIGVRCAANTVFKELEILDTETPLFPMYAGPIERLEMVDGGYIRYAADGTFEAFRRYTALPSPGANETLTTEWDLSDKPIVRTTDGAILVTVLTPSPDQYTYSADIDGKKLIIYTRRTTAASHHFCVYYKGFWR